MAELKTKLNNASVTAFLKKVPDDTRRQDSLALLPIMKRAAKAEPKMWGDAIVGFDSYHYKGASGREGDWPIVAFSPRKESLTLYAGGIDRYKLFGKLGKCKMSGSCLHIKRLADVDLKVLEQLLCTFVKDKKKKYS